jgi:hypothetical protein
MLRPVSLVDQWQEIVERLPRNWSDANLRLTIPDEGDCDRAAALLGPANPGRRGKVIRFFATRAGAGMSADRVRGLLRRLDAEDIDGDLELVGAEEATAPAAVERKSLAAAWDAAVATLPPDWSDVYAELDLSSTDYLDRGAIELSPVNPQRYGGRPGFRFRCARRFGYGASPQMVRRCLERCDAAGIRGQVRIVRALSDTKPAYTQGPVWYAGGRAT